MALLDKEKIKTLAAEKSMEMLLTPMMMQTLQNPKVINALVKTFEHGRNTRARIHNAANIMAKTFDIGVKK